VVSGSTLAELAELRNLAGRDRENPWCDSAHHRPLRFAPVGMTAEGIALSWAVSDRRPKCRRMAGRPASAGLGRRVCWTVRGVRAPWLNSKWP
jgi:hypothetical protein